MEGGNCQVEQTFLGCGVPGMTINANNGAVVKVVFNIVVQREEDSLRKFARWIEAQEHAPMGGSNG